MQREIARQVDLVRALESPQESLLSGRHPYFFNMSLEQVPDSPRHTAFDESRRSSAQLTDPLRPYPARGSISTHSPASPRRYGSTSTVRALSPGFSRPHLPLHPPPQTHPLASVVLPTPAANMARRHTSADIREHGWPVPNPDGSPYASGNSSTQWPSSPHHYPQSGDQHLRDHLASYSINGPRRQTVSSQQPSPPHISEPVQSVQGADNVPWSIGGPKFPRQTLDLNSAPETRRSSVASNVHSLLNPTDTTGRFNGDDTLTDDRKRKRLQ